MNLALMAATVGITLVVTEKLLDVFYPLASPVNSYRMPDPVLGWRLQPGASVLLRNRDYVHSVRVNADGWRDVERGRTKPDGVLRVALLGDSFMEAYSVELDEAFSRQLEARLARPERPVEVLNFGVGGYGTLQEYLTFVHVAADYAPDLVLLAFLPGNDVRDNSLELETVFYRGRENYKLKTRPYLVSAAGEEWRIREPDVEIAKGEAALRATVTAPRPWFKKTSLWSLGSMARQRLREQLTGVPADPPTDPSVWLGPYLCDESAAYRRAWQTTGRILERLHREVLDRGARLVVFTVPSLLDVDPAWLAEAASGLPDPETCTDHRLAMQRSMELLHRIGIPAIDLSPAFREATSRGLPLFHTIDDQHWNGQGHALAAEITAASIRERMLSGQTTPPWEDRF